MDNSALVTVLIAMLGGAIRVSTPFMFVALGETLTEKSGRINLGLEGNLVLGAMVAYAVSYLSGNPWLGVLAAGRGPLGQGFTDAQDHRQQVLQIVRGVAHGRGRPLDHGMGRGLGARFGPVENLGRRHRGRPRFATNQRWENWAEVARRPLHDSPPRLIRHPGLQG